MTGQLFAVLGGALPWFAAVEEMDVITAERDDYEMHDGAMTVPPRTKAMVTPPRQEKRSKCLNTPSWKSRFSIN